MSLTFEETINRLETDTIGNYEMQETLENLRDIYAPTIEMTSDEIGFLLFYLNEGLDFSDFIHQVNVMGGYKDKGLYLHISENKLMQAWLHLDNVKEVE